MSVPKLKAKLTFETRLALHWLFVPMAVILFFHAPRCAYITLAFVGVWALDYAYMFFTRTHRLDAVAFTKVKGGGVQVRPNGPRSAQRAWTLCLGQSFVHPAPAG